MGAIDIARDAIRVVSSAGLSKDVIDLLEKKLALLTDEIKGLLSKVSQLEADNANLKAQLQRLQPAESLPKETDGVLQFFFDQACDLSIEQVAQRFHLEMSVAEYHFDVLRKRRFVRQACVVSIGSSAAFELTPEGRAYVMRNRT